ncbi:MAG TPA: cation:proton antiporter subunit C [Bacteroidales bacterium]|jgi:multisubunit Na+/H+ antiporter MnhC subunit|nr:cation:proton antiporter subunit C [Bacteroidales bacterium]HOX74978.1 cation:proton antiporter subunit C [Bacteroidales bacterium]HQM68277.1 cation:proton antiporter subunit C [Bacteroidales bacterium]
MIPYLMCFGLFLTGLYGIITRRNLVKIAISLSVMEFSTFLFLALIGYIEGGTAPIVDPADPVKVYVDPLPQALVLTAIVIGLATTAMIMAVIIRIYRKYGTFDIREIKNLKG